MILLNGHTDSAAYPSVLSASFDVTSDSYFAKKFNTNPLLVEEHCYVLYNHYDILPAFAVPTGSGVAAESAIRKLGVAEALT